MNDYIIRKATPRDAKAVHDIYGYYVENTSITFSSRNPSVREYKKLIRETGRLYPFFVAVDAKNGDIAGFVHGEGFRPHEAYRWVLESTIYLSPAAPKRRGIGRLLYEAFFKALTAQGYRSVFAVVTSVNAESIAFHKALGFQELATFADIGCKKGTWYGVTYLRRDLAPAKANPPEVTPFRNLTT